MAGYPPGELGESGVDLVAITVPVAVAIGLEVSRWRGADESKLFHAALDRCSPRDDFIWRDRWEDGDAHRPVLAQRRCEGVLPDSVAARNDDRQERAAEATRERERSGLECDFDAEDGALGEEEDALPGSNGSAGAAMEASCGGDRALGANEEVPSAPELAAEQREGGELVASDGREREGEMEEGEAVGETLVKGNDDVSLIGVDVFETTDVNAQTDEAGGEPSPPPLGGPAGRPTTQARGAMVWQRRGEAKDEPGGTEENEHGGPGPEPLASGADGEIAAEEGAWGPHVAGDGRARAVRHHWLVILLLIVATDRCQPARRGAPRAR